MYASRNELGVSTSIPVLERWLRDSGSRAFEDFSITDEEDFASKFDGSRLVRATYAVDGLPMDAVLALYTDEATSWLVLLEGPHAAFSANRTELERIAKGLVAPHLDPPALSDRVLSLVAASTVMILTPQGFGSGFVISHDHGIARIVTNEHVVADAAAPGNWTPYAVQVLFSDAVDRTPIPARVRYEESHLDLAILDVLDPGRHAPLPVATQLLDPVGADVFAIGYPGGISYHYREWYPLPVTTSGRLLGMEADEERRLRLALDIPINPGNSGGPVINRQGTVVGVAVSKLMGTTKGWAVPALALRDTFDQLDAGTLPPPSPPRNSGDHPAPPVGSPDDLARLTDATVMVRSGSQEAPGIVLTLPELGSRVVVLTRFGVSRTDSGTRGDTIRVFRTRHQEPQGNPAHVLRATKDPDLALLEVVGVDGGWPGLALGSTDELEDTSHVVAAGLVFDSAFGSSTNVDVVRVRGQVAGHQVLLGATGGQPRLVELRIDTGVSPGLHLGPVIGSHGQLVGWARAFDPESTLGSVVLASRIQDFLRGGIRGGAAAVGGDDHESCWVEALLELDDPLGRIREVGLSKLTYGLPTTGAFLPASRTSAARATPDGGMAVLTWNLKSCKEGEILTVEPWVADDHGPHPEPWGAYEIKLDPSVGVHLVALGDLGTGGDLPPSPLSELGHALQTPAGWPDACSAGATCEARCDGGDGAACGGWAQGLLAQHDPQSAHDALTRGCRLGSLSSCDWLAYLVGTKDIPGNLHEAEAWACDPGDAADCNLLADTESASTSRRKLTEQACQLGNGDACLSLWDLVRIGPDAGSGSLFESGALRYIQQACLLGSGKGCWYLAQWYDNSQFLSHNHGMAYFLDGRACDEGYARGCFDQADRLEKGDGAAPDEDRAAELYRMSCKLGDYRGCQLTPGLPAYVGPAGMRWPYWDSMGRPRIVFARFPEVTASSVLPKWAQGFR